MTTQRLPDAKVGLHAVAGNLAEKIVFTDERVADDARPHIRRDHDLDDAVGQTIAVRLIQARDLVNLHVSGNGNHSRRHHHT